MKENEYWQEAFETAFDEAGAFELIKQLTSEQRVEIGKSLAGWHENIRLAFPLPENPLARENSLLERQLKWERELIACGECGAQGRIYTQGPYHCSDSQCWKCNGRGKYHPNKKAQPL